MKTGRTAGGGLILGLVLGVIFGNVALGIVFGLVLGAAVASARRGPSDPNGQVLPFGSST